MKRLRTILIASACAAAAAAATVPWRVTEAIHRLDVAPQIGRIAGLSVAEAGEARFTLLPVPRLEIAGLRLADAAGTTRLDTMRVRARARLLPLLGGRFDVTEVTLYQPRLVLPAGETALPIVDSLLGTGGPEAPHLLLDRVAVIDGAVLERKGDDLNELAGSLDLLATRGSAKAVDVEGRMTWRGQPVAISARGFDLKALSGGPTAPLKASATTPLGSVDFDGTVLPGTAWQAEGHLRLASPAIERLADWLGFVTPLPIAGSMTLAATSVVRPDGVSLDGVRLTLPAGILEGVLTMKRAEGPPALRGTLASDRLDLNALLRGLPDLRGDDGGWSAEAFDPALLPRGDVDLRLSAGRIVLGQTTIGGAAVSVLSRNGRTDVALANAEIFKGDLRGRASLSPSPRGVDVKLAATLDRADTAALLQSVSVSRRIGGALHASIQVETSGESLQGWMRALDGRGAVTVRQGDLVGINLPEVLRRVEKRPLVTALDVRGGRTPFDVAHMTLKATRGTVDVSEAAIQSPAARVTLSGQIVLAERQLGLTGLAQLAEPGSEASALPFDLTGSFDEPLVVLDSRSLIRRAGAPAPASVPRPDAFAPPP